MWTGLYDVWCFVLKLEVPKRVKIAEARHHDLPESPAFAWQGSWFGCSQKGGKGTQTQTIAAVHLTLQFLWPCRQSANRWLTLCCRDRPAETIQPCHGNHGAERSLATWATCRKSAGWRLAQCRLPLGSVHSAWEDDLVVFLQCDLLWIQLFALSQ